MTTYRVTAPMVLLKIRGVGDKAIINSFYAGATVPESAAEIDPVNVKRHVDRGWIEEVDEPAAPAPEPTKVPEPDPNAVPDSTADKVLAWVGDSQERAKRALAVEQAGAKRKTLVDQLIKLTDSK